MSAANGPRLLPADPSDPGLDPYRAVRDADLRGRDGLCCVETARVVRRFLASCARAHAAGADAWGALACVPRSVLCDRRTLAQLGPALDALPPVDVFVAEDAAAVTAISGYGLHSGALAIGERRPEPGPAALAPLGGTLAACDGIAHTDNVGAIFRNAASLGVAGVLLSPGSSDPLLRKTVRVAMGRVFDVPWARATEWPAALWDLQRAGWRVVAAEDAPGARPVAEVPPRDRTVVVFGAEAAGVRAEILERADVVARIPMSARGGALADDPPSLNVAVASAIVMDRLATRDR
jgi:tRNA G18 (ribose-2'-O)-methylase SpoU